MDRAPASPWTTAALMVGLATLVLALFGPVIGYDFVKLDDAQYIADNPLIAAGLSADNIRWAFTTVYEDWWAPALWISFMADTSLFGPGPFGHHLVNLLLHATNALLLFWILRRVFRSPWPAFFAAALYAVHPLRVESVAWITERKDVLSGFFFLLAIETYFRHAERPSPLLFGGVHAWMLLGLLSKSSVVVLPFLLLLLDIWPLGRLPPPAAGFLVRCVRPLVAEKSVLFALAAIFMLMTVGTHKTVGELAIDPSWTNRLLLIAPAYLTHLARFFWPAHLSLIYPPDSPSMAIRLAAPLILLMFGTTAWRFRRVWPALGIGLLWYLLAFGPVIRGIRFDEQSATPDRYTYLPDMGLVLALGWGAAELIRRRPRTRLPLAVLGMAMIAAAAARTAARLPDWRNSDTMFTCLLADAPNHPFANNSYGKVLLESGRAADALPYFLRAAELGDSVAPRNYADALLRLGRDEEALTWLDKALHNSNLDHPDTLALMGIACLNANRAADAIPHLRQALAANPGGIGLRIALARAAFETGDEAEARREIAILRTLGCSNITDFTSLIAYYAVIGQDPAQTHHAWCFFKNNLFRHPDDIVLLNNAAWLLATLPAPPAPAAEALRLARHAANLAVAPHPGILDTLAAAQAANGDFATARETARQALDLARANGDKAMAEDIARRLEQYRQEHPWREGVQP